MMILRLNANLHVLKDSYLYYKKNI